MMPDAFQLARARGLTACQWDKGDLFVSHTISLIGYGEAGSTFARAGGWGEGVTARAAMRAQACGICVPNVWLWPQTMG
jgi:hypothetical protein